MAELREMRPNDNGVPHTVQYAWLLEIEGVHGPEYFTGRYPDGRTTDAYKALWMVREQDATRMRGQLHGSFKPVLHCFE